MRLAGTFARGGRRTIRNALIPLKIAPYRVESESHLITVIRVSLE